MHACDSTVFAVCVVTIARFVSWLHWVLLCLLLDMSVVGVPDTAGPRACGMVGFSSPRTIPAKMITE